MGPYSGRWSVANDNNVWATAEIPPYEDAPTQVLLTSETDVNIIQDQTTQGETQKMGEHTGIFQNS